MSALLVWVIVFFCVFKGVKSSSYVVYFTVPLPVFFIFLLVMKGLTLPNASAGIRMYLQGENPATGELPVVSEVLGDTQIWADACAQIFFSLGVCMGVMTSYASYNPRDKPIIKNAFVISIGNCSLSFFAGFAVFSVVGYLNGLGHPVASRTSSTGLAFIAYPAAIETLPGANFWSLLLSLTLFMLGIDSAFSFVEAASTVIYDTPTGKKSPRMLTALILCTIGALMSLIFCFNWGFTFFDVIDHYLAVYLMLLLGLFQAFAISWVYEAKDVMEKHGRGPVLVLTFSYWIPLVLGGIIGFASVPTLNVNWVFVLLLVVSTICGSIVSLCMSKLSFREWYSQIALAGVRKIARSMTKLSKQPGQPRRWWEGIFESWWGLSVKYFIPWALWWLLIMSARNDLTKPYGGYHNFWQWIGFLFPLAGLLSFFIPLIVCTRREDFGPEVDEAFEEEVRVKEGQVAPSDVELTKQNA